MILFLRLLLAPIAILYGLVIYFRNVFYALGVLTRSKFDIPIICVGNLSAGGTGKTPHIEWIISKLLPQYQLAILSRGYKRKTTGYLFATSNHTPEEIGDEPFQLAAKYKQVAVGVSENRVLGVPQLLADAPATDVVLMDDGFQHLPIKAGFNVLLTDYNRLYSDDFLMPYGTLREFRSGASRAECIVVTKCKPDLSLGEAQQIKTKLNPKPNQVVFFTSIDYLPLKPVYPDQSFNPQFPYSKAIAFSGIAKHQLFENQIKLQYTLEKHLIFADHQTYSNQEIEAIIHMHQQCEEAIIITTEKDSVKLHKPEFKNRLKSLPLFYLPVTVNFLFNEEAQFLSILKGYIEPTLAAYRDE